MTTADARTTRDTHPMAILQNIVHLFLGIGMIGLGVALGRDLNRRTA